MTAEEAKEWLNNSEYVRCKEKASDVLFDCMLWEEDAVIIRQASPDPAQLYIISMDVFAKKFSALGD